MISFEQFLSVQMARQEEDLTGAYLRDSRANIPLA
jgi:hypothetical protein